MKQLIASYYRSFGNDVKAGFRVIIADSCDISHHHNGGGIFVKNFHIVYNQCPEWSCKQLKWCYCDNELTKIITLDPDSIPKTVDEAFAMYPEIFL